MTRRAEWIAAQQRCAQARAGMQPHLGFAMRSIEQRPLMALVLASAFGVLAATLLPRLRPWRSWRLLRALLR